MKIKTFSNAMLLLLSTITFAQRATAQEIFADDNSAFRVSGYLRTGFGKSEGGETQAHFQMPGALNKYSLGNQAETYGELQFDYSIKFRNKSIGAVWMTSIYEDFGSTDKMHFNFSEQLYLKANNLLGMGETIWGGKRFYERKAIYMLDRQWLNPGQGGWGFGVEDMLSGDEDLKFAVWRFNNDNVTSYATGERGHLFNYTADLRWVDHEISDYAKINFALNYNYRAANKQLGYDGKHGFGAFAWVDYSRDNLNNTTALLVRQGSNSPINHWTGKACKENPFNNNYVTSDLGSAYTLELNNELLYDDKESWAVNVITMAVLRNYGTSPYEYVNGDRNYVDGLGRTMYWLTAGARGSYYLSKNFRLTLEYTHEYINNRHMGAAGHLNKLTFTSEIALAKGYYSRPIVRPFVNYAAWSEGLKGFIGTTPTGAPFTDKTNGLTYGMQFEMWW